MASRFRIPNKNIYNIILAGICLCGFQQRTAAQVNPPAPKTDSSRAENKYSLNAAFDKVYRENLPASFFGNEYGEPLRTQLVADINPNVLLLSSAKSRFFFLFSPRVQLRLLSAYHAPVKSPSYMPGGTLFTRLNNNPSRPKYMSIAYSHHSNGQEGPTLDSAGNFNHDGKFTTNFYTLAYYFGKREFTNTLAQSQQASVNLEVHTGLFNTGYSHQLLGKYGFIRTNGSWYYDIMGDKSGLNDHYTSHQRIRFDFMYILDKVYDYNITDAAKRLNASLKYYYQFGFMESAALTVQAGYRGQDPYNIFFRDNYPYFAIGLATGTAFDLHKKRHY